MQYLRFVKRMSMNHIADVFQRSTSTIHLHVKGTPWDNRNNPPHSRTKGVTNFQSIVHSLRLKVQLFLKGIVRDIDMAIAEKMVPVSLIDYLNEISSEDEDEDPA